MDLISGSLVAVVLVMLSMGGVTAADDTCNTALPFKTDFPITKCEAVWSTNNFILRSSQTTSPSTNHHLLNVILSAKQSEQWVGIGFSETGMMMGSSAVVAWPGAGGAQPTIAPYFLQVPSSAGVIIDVNGSHVHLVDSQVFMQDTTMYLSFQVDTNASSASFNMILYAIGPVGVLPTNDVLPHHINVTITPNNF